MISGDKALDDNKLEQYRLQLKKAKENKQRIDEWCERQAQTQTKKTIRLTNTQTFFENAKGKE